MANGDSETCQQGGPHGAHTWTKSWYDININDWVSETRSCPGRSANG